MTRLLVVAAVTAVLLCWCGSSNGTGGTTDYATNFIGTWFGTTTLTANGQSQVADGGNAVITETGTNAIAIAGGCFLAPDGGVGSLPATVNSPTSATFSPYTCPAFSVGPCPSVVQQWTGGTGTLSGTTLSLAGTGNLVGCTVTEPFSVTFVGTK